MKRAILSSMVLAGLVLLTSSLSNPLPAAEPTPIAVQQVPASAKLVKIPLSLAPQDANANQYWGQQGGGQLQPMSPVPETLKALPDVKEENAVFDLTTFPDGQHFYAVIGNAKNLRMMGRNNSALWHAQIIRVVGDGKPEVSAEGFTSNDGSVPVTVKIPPTGSDHATEFQTTIGFNVNGSMNGTPTINVSSGRSMILKGSQVLEAGKLEATLTLGKNLTFQPDAKVDLRFIPLKAGLPERTASGAASDFLTLGVARFAVTEVAADVSSITIAIVDGSLEETLEQQLHLEQEMPNFAQTDLITRKTVTRGDLLKRAAEEKRPIVFVFGEFPMAQENMYGGQGRPGALPVGGDQISQLLSADAAKKPLVVNVVREIDNADLYGAYTSQLPEYVILADYTDVMRTTFRMKSPYNGGGMSWGGMVDQGATLRQLFNLPSGTVSVVAFDSAGKVIYVKANASGDKFLPTLNEAGKALAGGK